jgi:hypothetical protein
MARRTLAVASALILFGCGSSNSEGGAAGAPAATAGQSGAPTTSGGEANAGEASGGSPSIGGTTGGGGAVASSGGSSGGGGDLPPLDPTADTRGLSDSDKGVLCDWMNDKMGGYGKMFTCSSKTVMNSPSQAVCISTFFNFQCEVTVQDVATCTIARAPSHACNTEFDSCHQLFCQ